MGGGSSKESQADLAAKYACKQTIKGIDKVQDYEDRILEAFKNADTDGNNKVSVDELRVFFKNSGKDLSDKDLKNLFKSADYDGSGDISPEEFVSWMFSAPYLKKMFQKQKEVMEWAKKEAPKLQKKIDKKVQKEMNKAENPFAAMGTAMKVAMEEAQKLQQKIQDRLEKEMKPLAKKSFKWHDKDDSGVLEKDESIVFFSNYVSYLVPNMMESGQMANIQQMNLGGQPGGQMDLGNTNAALKEALTKRQAEYKADADNRHLAAFQCLDVNKDGKLQESELVDALIPGNPQNEKLARALGIFIDPGELMAAAMQDMAGAMQGAMQQIGDDDGCPQQ